MKRLAEDNTSQNYLLVALRRFQNLLYDKDGSSVFCKQKLNFEDDIKMH